MTATTLAADFQDRLAAIDPQTVPVMTRDRRIPRKEQAALARQLFRRLGLRGISVTTPNYSMASSVDVTLPARDDYAITVYGMAADDCPARAANNRALAAVRAILAAAFPCHDDRSDYVSDYFDFKWSIS